MPTGMFSTTKEQRQAANAAAGIVKNPVTGVTSKVTTPLITSGPSNWATNPMNPGIAGYGGSIDESGNYRSLTDYSTGRVWAQTPYDIPFSAFSTGTQDVFTPSGDYLGRVTSQGFQPVGSAYIVPAGNFAGGDMAPFPSLTSSNVISAGQLLTPPSGTPISSYSQRLVSLSPGLSGITPTPAANQYIAPPLPSVKDAQKSLLSPVASIAARAAGGAGLLDAQKHLLSPVASIAARAASGTGAPAAGSTPVALSTAQTRIYSRLAAYIKNLADTGKITPAAYNTAMSRLINTFGPVPT